MTPTTRAARVVVHGVSLVGAKLSTDIPDKLVLGADETDKDLVARLPKPDFGWFERIVFPPAAGRRHRGRWAGDDDVHRRGARDEEGEVTATAGASNDVDAFRSKRLGCGIPIPSRPAAEVSSHQPGQRANRREIECSSDRDVVTPVSQRR